MNSNSEKKSSRLATQKRRSHRLFADWLSQLLIDLLLVNGAVFASFILRLLFEEHGGVTASYFSLAYFLSIPLFSVVYTVLFFVTGTHQVYWAYSTTNDLLRVGVSATGTVVICFAAGYLSSYLMPRLVYIMALLSMLLLLMAFRAFLRIRGKMGDGSAETSGEKERMMVIGAGLTGNYLLHELHNNPAYANVRAVCVVDDDKSKQGKLMYGVPVAGGTQDIAMLAKQHHVSIIAFAVSSCSTERRAEILSECIKTGCTVRTIPPFSSLIEGKVSISSMQKISLDDLLGRDPVRIDTDQLSEYVRGKVVLVTGGGGSIGSELCRQIASFRPKRLIILDIYENNAYEIQNELKRKYPALDLVVRIASVRDHGKLDRLFNEFRPQLIYHAAAHKHVPLMEDAPDEAVKNNIFGTLNVVQMADRYEAERFVMISTDKAVNPTNIMGATKRVCEMLIQTYNRYSNTEFVAVRFGNVLGSNGSVIPLFKKQIEEGGPVTVTHPDIIRYFMTIPEAVSLVLQAGASASGGEIFVLNMGKPVKILSLAENLIRLSGHVPNVDIPIVFTGLRPGEKLYEELLMSEEGLQKTENELIYIGEPIKMDERTFFAELSELRHTAEEGGDVFPLMHQLVPTFHEPDLATV